MRTLAKGEIERIHVFTTKEFGGKAGVRDGAVLEQLLSRAYAHVEDGIEGVAAKLMEEIVEQAPFLEGNMRTAFFVADVLLRLNGFYLRCDNMLTLKFFKALFEEQRFSYEHLLPWVKTNTVRL